MSIMLIPIIGPSMLFKPLAEFFSMLSEQFNEIEKSGKLHVCSVCKKTFADKSHLKSHMAVHTEEELYKCTL